jgi:hypothetical protein
MHSHSANHEINISIRQTPVLPSARHILNVLRNLLKYAERNTCLHEETYRGGTNWEICSSCGARWADDEGGKPAGAHEYPKAILDAQNLLILYK